VSNPDDPINVAFDDLTSEQRKSLIRLANAWSRVEGWCLVNRAIGRVILIGGLGLIILLSQSIDAIKNLARSFGR
jgi:hypothetical protein